MALTDWPDMAGWADRAVQAFMRLRQSPVFADKSGMLAPLGRLCLTEGRFVCLSRPRGFGKSADACMLAACFGPEGKSISAGLAAAGAPAFDRLAGKFEAVFLDVEALLAESGGGEAFMQALERGISRMLGARDASLSCALKDACRCRPGRFVLVVDGWDAPLDSPSLDGPARSRWLGLLEALCRARDVWALVCLLGESLLERFPAFYAGLPRFASFTMRNPGVFGPWTGIGEQAVRRICREQRLDFGDLLAWHGGWSWDLSGRMFAPVSVAGFANTRRHERFYAGSWAGALLARLLEACPELGEALALLAEGERVRIGRCPGLQEGFGAGTFDGSLLQLVHAGLAGYRLHTGEAFAPCLEVRHCLLEALAKGKGGGRRGGTQATPCLDVRQERP